MDTGECAGKRGGESIVTPICEKNTLSVPWLSRTRVRLVRLSSQNEWSLLLCCICQVMIFYLVLCCYECMKKLLERTQGVLVRKKIELETRENF